MQNKQSLLNLVDRAERGVLLPAEAQILRDAIESLDELGMLHDAVTTKGDCCSQLGFDPSDTMSFRIPPAEDQRWDGVHAAHVCQDCE